MPNPLTTSRPSGLPPLARRAGRPRGTSEDQRRRDALQSALYAARPFTISICSNLVTAIADPNTALERTPSGAVRFAIPAEDRAGGQDVFVDQSRKTARRFSHSGPYRKLRREYDELAEVAEDTAWLIVILQARYLDTMDAAVRRLGERGWPAWMLDKIANFAVDGRTVTWADSEPAWRDDATRCLSDIRRAFGGELITL